MTMTAALILIMALTLTISSALGIHLFNFDLERYVDGFAILRNNEDEEDGKYFYQPEYLVEGYKLSYEETSDGFRDYSYESKSGDEELFYYVSECITRDADIRISTENCVEKTLVHGAYEILMYQNTEREQWNSAYLEIDGTYISIGGSISEEEILKIIDSLQIDREYAK